MSDDTAKLIAAIYDDVEHVGDPWLLCARLGEAAAELERLSGERDEARRKAAIYEAGAKIGGDVLYERWQKAEADRDALTKALRDLRDYANGWLVPSDRAGIVERIDAALLAVGGGQADSEAAGGFAGKDGET